MHQGLGARVELGQETWDSLESLQGNQATFQIEAGSRSTSQAVERNRVSCELHWELGDPLELQRNRPPLEVCEGKSGFRVEVRIGPHLEIGRGHGVLLKLRRETRPSS